MWQYGSRGLNEHIVQNKLSNVCIITQKEIASYLIGELIISKMLSIYRFISFVMMI